MNITEKAEKAVQLKGSGSYNCCQAVTLALAEETDVPEDILRDIASGFGSGMGNMEATCGALVGAGMIASLVIADRGRSRSAARKISEEFKNMCGAYLCKDLKGRDTRVPLCPCDQCVYNAVIAYGKVMEAAV